MKDPKVCPLTGQLFTVDSWEAGRSKRESPLFLRPCDTPKIRKTICQTDEKTHHYLSKKQLKANKTDFLLSAANFLLYVKKSNNLFVLLLPWDCPRSMANKVELQERNGPWAHVSFVLGSHAPEASRPKQIKNMALLSPSCMKKPKLLFLFVVAKDPFFAMLSSIPKSFLKCQIWIRKAKVIFIFNLLGFLPWLKYMVSKPWDWLLKKIWLGNLWMLHGIWQCDVHSQIRIWSMSSTDWVKIKNIMLS